jgi:hypothetical protein
VAAVLDAAESAAMEILVHADGDHAGAAIAATVLKRTGAKLWRPVDPRAGVHEESLLDELLEDLGSGWIGQRRLVA